MNCKPGDLAVITTSVTGKSLGRIVTCLRLTEYTGMTNPDGSTAPGPVWEVDASVVSWSGEVHNFVRDAALRPIRDPGEDARDETLNWLPVPRKNKEPA